MWPPAAAPGPRQSSSVPAARKRPPLQNKRRGRNPIGSVELFVWVGGKKVSGCQDAQKLTECRTSHDQEQARERGLIGEELVSRSIWKQGAHHKSPLRSTSTPSLSWPRSRDREPSRCCRSVVRLRPLDLVRARGRRRRGHRKRPAASDGGLGVVVCLVWFLRDRFGWLIEAFLKRQAVGFADRLWLRRLRGGRLSPSFLPPSDKLQERGGHACKRQPEEPNAISRRSPP